MATKPKAVKSACVFCMHLGLGIWHSVDTKDTVCYSKLPLLRICTIGDNTCSVCLLLWSIQRRSRLYAWEVGESRGLMKLKEIWTGGKDPRTLDEVSEDASDKECLLPLRSDFVPGSLRSCLRP